MMAPFLRTSTVHHMPGIEAKPSASEGPMRGLASATTGSRSSTGLFAVAAIFAAVAAAWTVLALPAIFRRVYPLPFSISFDSRDRLYDEALGDYGPLTVTKSSFSYSENGGTGRLVGVLGEFDVRKLTGERVFNAVREFVVDPLTGRLDPAEDARYADGYLYAPRFLGKDDFTFWYVSYDAPIRMRYVGEGRVNGLRTYHYVAQFQLDNTANFVWLVGDSGKRVRYHVSIDAWFEPVSGHLVKIDDGGSIELFDGATGETIRPWNRYRNEQSEASVATEVSRAESERSVILSSVALSPAFVIAALTAAIMAFRRRRRSDAADELRLFPFALDAVAPVLVVLALSSMATATAWQLSRVYVDDQRRAIFNTESQRLLDAVRVRMDTAANMLRSGVALANASTSVQRDEWRAFASTIGIDQRFPGILGIGLVRAFPEDRRDAFLREVRADGQPDFVIGPATGADGKPDPVPERVAGAMHAVVTFIEPRDAANLLAIGHDLMTNAVRRKALESARDSGDVALTGKVTLAQDQLSPTTAGVQMILPFYRHGAAVGTVAERRDALEGYVYSPIRVPQLVGDALETKQPLVDVTIYDGETTDAPLLYTHSAGEGRGVLRRSDTLIVGGRPWTLVFSEVPGAIVPGNASFPQFTLFTGVGVTFLVMLTAVALSTSRRRAVGIARRASAALVERNNQLQKLIDAVPVGIYWAEAPSGRVIMVNRKTVELLGRGVDPKAGKTGLAAAYAFEREDGKPYPDADLPLNRTLESGDIAAKRDIFVRRPDGVRIAIRAVSAPIREIDGKFTSAVVVFDDFTKEYELDRQKSDFISITSHQLRTPLAAIRWFMEILEGGDIGPLNAEQKENVHMVMESNARLISLVNDLLNVSRIEAGSIEVAPVETDLDAMAKGVVGELAPLAAERKLQVTFVPPGVPLKVKVDPKLIRQVFVNLLSNAVKYTPEGGSVKLTAEVHGDEVQFAVADTGIGIPLADQERLFTKFFRAGNAMSSEADGSGLGLYVCRAIVEMSGGRIWFESVENAGTIFFFTLPLKGSPAKRGSKSLA